MVVISSSLSGGGAEFDVVMSEVQERVLEGRLLRSELGEGYSVQGSESSDGRSVQSADDQSPFASGLDLCPAGYEQTGEFFLKCYRFHPNGRSSVVPNHVIDAGVGDDLAPPDDKEVIGGVFHLTHEVA